MTVRIASPATVCSMPRSLAATIILAAFTLWFGLSPAISVRGADWPTYRHDVARSGITAESVSLPLAPAWVFRARHAPQPAWGDPKAGPVEEILELRRRHFDDVFQPVVEGDAVFFGSSANHKVYCLDANTGAIRWTKITGGPGPAGALAVRRPGVRGLRRWIRLLPERTAGAGNLEAACRAGGPPRAGARQDDLAVAVPHRRAGR